MKDYPETLPGLLARNKDRYGSRTALREKDLGIWQEVSWDRYYDHVKHLCLGLISLGLQRGEKVSILGDNCREWIYGDLAVQCAGAVAVGVYPTNPARQVEYIVGHSDSVMVIVRDQEQVDKILEVKGNLPRLGKIIVIDMKGLRRYDDPDILPFTEVERLGQELARENPSRFEEEFLSKTRLDDVALMVYTSGTTGPPKGAMLTHRNLLSIGKSFSRVLHISDRDQVVSYLPLCHIAERLLSVILGLSVGPPCNLDVTNCQECLAEQTLALEKREKDIISITSLKPGQKGKIAFIQGGKGVIQRLCDLGLTNRTSISIIRSAPLNGPIEICVRGCKIVIGRDIANKIFVHAEG